MNPRYRSDLDRVSAESTARTAAASRSCEDTTAHIASSRNLLARSLELLRRTRLVA